MSLSKWRGSLLERRPARQDSHAIYYRITPAGHAAPDSVIADPIAVLYEYPREVRSAKAKRLI